ncbi:AAA family ATPase [Staphylococcus haemolyticus]|uniref:AAA family ATPase n=1 Tax=Staphylococcus haemolyticus TaxID=1283 RepID=UPI0031B9E82E
MSSSQENINNHIIKLSNLELDKEYNSNFKNYIYQEVDNIIYYYIQKEDRTILDVINGLLNKEIIIEEVDITSFEKRRGYGGGPPLSANEEKLFILQNIINSKIDLERQLDDFVNNLDILKVFSEIHKNTVIIGANGSGKSTLSRKLKVDKFNDYINIIASHHMLYLSNDNFVVFRNNEQILDIESYQNSEKIGFENEPFDITDFNSDLHNLVNYLLNNHYSQRGDTIQTDKTDKTDKTILEDIIGLWNKITKKNMIISNNVIVCVDENECEYDFNNLSDGERQVFYFIANVLGNENDGYIIIDEPENHLNPQICISLWDELEKMKANSTFVYITHDPNFAITRTNSKILWSKKYIHPNYWDFEILSSTEIPEQLLIEILGSKENIIFCEGESGSEDEIIYTSLFDSKVIPVGGHRTVISYTNAINKMQNLHIEANGIIDSDGKSKEEISKYKNKDIFVLPFNEIEMLLLCDEVMDSVNEVLSLLGQSFDKNKLKSEIFEECGSSQEEIISRNAKSIIDNKLESQKLEKVKDSKGLKENFDQLVKSIDTESIINEKKKELLSILQEEDYEELLYICNLKNKILKGVTRKFIRDYKEMAISRLKQDENLKSLIQTKYL